MSKILFILLGLFLSFASCSGQSQQSVSSKQEYKEFSLPVIPADLREPLQRADYLLIHYWDNLDFADTLYTGNREYMEQMFVNFLSILPVVSPDSISKGVEHLMQRAEVNPACHNLLAEWAEKYLYDPNSPMLSEMLYLPFATSLSRSSVLHEAVRTRYARHRTHCLMNRPGSLAADFAYLAPDGVRYTLYQTEAPLTLLFFYDPDCENCHAMMDELDRHPQLSELIARKQLKVLAVYADGDPKAWKRGVSHIPATWTNAYECEGKILNEEVYHLRAMPTLYLLDADKRVLLKDVLPEALYEFFQSTI